MKIWNKSIDGLPPEGIDVETKINDVDGERNHQIMQYKQGLWWIDNGKIYVYYRPTHWRNK